MLSVALLLYMPTHAHRANARTVDAASQSAMAFISATIVTSDDATVDTTTLVLFLSPHLPLLPPLPRPRYSSLLSHLHTAT
ncbi:MAG: hypothetical protein P4M11_03905 [Candidatus Pacebacteria bacterium]|nr:hypothetical protein [Candidatus Paceibacterota bacterium]